MGHFIYFLSGFGGGTADAKNLLEYGLGYLLDGQNQSISSNQCSRGPGGEAGLTICAGPGEPAYRPDSQTWRQIPNSKAWCGYETLPGPGDLERSELLGVNYETLLGDGNVWKVPAGQQWSEYEGKMIPLPALPCKAELNESGQWIRGDVIDELKPLWDATQKLWDLRIGLEEEDKPAVTYDDVTTIAELALSANYRISRIEIMMLGLIDDVTRKRIFSAIVDEPAFIELFEKKTSEGAGT